MLHAPASCTSPRNPQRASASKAKPTPSARASPDLSAPPDRQRNPTCPSLRTAKSFRTQANSGSVSGSPASFLTSALSSSMLVIAQRLL